MKSHLNKSGKYVYTQLWKKFLVTKALSACLITLSFHNFERVLLDTRKSVPLSPRESINVNSSVSLCSCPCVHRDIHNKTIETYFLPCYVEGENLSLSLKWYIQTFVHKYKYKYTACKENKSKRLQSDVLETERRQFRFLHIVDGTEESFLFFFPFGNTSELKRKVAESRREVSPAEI